MLPRSDDGHPEGWGWSIPATAVPFPLENIHTDYNTEPTAVTFVFESGCTLSVHIARRGSLRLLIGKLDRILKTASAVRDYLDLRLSIIPTLGPVEREEEVVDEDYLQSWAGSHRASRLFRNMWYRDPANFEEFAALVESTWPGITITKPVKADLLSKRLVMFCKEHRIDREIGWAGSGFQIWLQLLTHLVRAKDATMIVVDEPEVYLHPDLHRKILNVLRTVGRRVVVATHSVEMVNEAEPSEIAIVEQGAQTARRLTDIEGLQDAVAVLGSSQNMVLSRLARARRVLFVEGEDKAILTKMASKLGHRVFTEGLVTVVPLRGFSEHDRIGHAQWAFARVLGQSLKVAVLLDRDYRNDCDVTEILAELKLHADIAHILDQKEVENYLLIPRVVQATIQARLAVRLEKGLIDCIPAFDALELLDEATESLRTDTHANLLARRLTKRSDRGLDPATIVKTFSHWFDETWNDIPKRMRIVSGKGAIAALNDVVSDRLKVNVSVPALLQNLRAHEIGTDLLQFLHDLESMATQ